MKKQNLYVSVVIILVAIGAGIYLMHRQVTAPVLPASNLTTTVAPGDDTDTSADAGDQSATDDTTNTGDKSFNLMCDSNKSMMVTFHLPDDKSVDVTLDDGTTMSLPNTSTQDTIQYSSADGSDVLAVDGSAVTLTENGTPTYTNCAPDAAATPDDSTTDQTGQ